MAFFSALSEPNASAPSIIMSLTSLRLLLEDKSGISRANVVPEAVAGKGRENPFTARFLTSCHRDVYPSSALRFAESADVEAPLLQVFPRFFACNCRSDEPRAMGSHDLYPQPTAFPFYFADAAAASRTFDVARGRRSRSELQSSTSLHNSKLSAGSSLIQALPVPPCTSHPTPLPRSFVTAGCSCSTARCSSGAVVTSTSTLSPRVQVLMPMSHCWITSKRSRKSPGHPKSALCARCSGRCGVQTLPTTTRRLHPPPKQAPLARTPCL